MKKTLGFIFILIALVSVAQEKDTWRIGGQWGFQGNKSQLIGGQSEADSHFEHQNAGAAALNVFARYDYDQHWMLISGLGLSSYGFEFSIAQNYSLLKPDSRKMTIKNDIGVLELPLMIHYKFKPNCKQVKWLVGAGFAQNLQTTVNTNGSYKQGSEANLGVSYFNTKVITKDALFTTIRFSVGREKRFENGGILNFSLLWNYGFGQTAKCTVNYNINGKDFEHQFGNNNNYFGLRMAYYFAPFKNTSKN